jgi:RND family efflux transporter MFP subunit
VASTPLESELAAVTLEPEAEARLGIVTAAVEERRAERTLALGGEAMVPPGRSVVLSAPLAGLLGLPEGGRPPAAGMKAGKGQPIFTLKPILPPADRLQLARAIADIQASRIGAQGEVDAARAELEAAKVALARARDLLRDKAGSAREADDAAARLALAEAKLEAAEARRGFLAKLSIEEAADAGQALSIEAAFEGYLLEVHATSGEIVSQGEALVVLARDDVLWIRVPVHAGDLPEVDRAREALVSPLSTTAEGSRWKATPAMAPPAGDPRAATVDLFYEIENDASRTIRPGERLSVTVFLESEEESLVVPWSSVILDVHGGTWVYESLGKGGYRRRRVDVRLVSGDLAVLHAGPGPGTRVVTAGTAELFGTELGFSK